MRAVVLDCSQVSCITNSGLTNLRDYAQELHKHGGQLRLAGLPQGARYNAQLVGFDNETVRQPDVAAALKSLSREMASSLPKSEAKG
jgi:anti-anti-sigma regulatory factor